MKFTFGLKIFAFVAFSYACSRPSKVNVDRAMYEELRIQLSDSINKYLLKSEGPYHSNKLNEKYMVVIDSIILSPDKSRLVTFVITQSINSQKDSSIENNTFFDGNCFIGIVRGKNIYRLKWFTALNVRRFQSFQNTSNEIRHQYFKDLNKIKDSNDKSLYKYNIGDERFWNSNVWKSYFGKEE